MRYEKVFTHPEKNPVVVKEGFSWPGLFFTFGWALYKNLWVHGITLAVWLIGSRFMSLYFERRLDENPADGTAAAAVILALVILVGTSIMVGLRGNRWVEQDLERRGYTLSETRAADSTSA